MNHKYLSLIQDTIKFAKQQRSIPFSECFFIKEKKQQITSTITPTFKTLEKKTIDSQPRKIVEPAIKEKAPPFRSELIKLENIQDNFEDVKTILKSIHPNTRHLDDILNDNEAKTIATNWKYQSQIAPILILVSSSDPSEKMFLKNLANALSISFSQVKVLDTTKIEKENTWDLILDAKIVKLIIAPDDQLWDLPNLMKEYKENPAQSTITIKNIPLFLIPNLKMYFQNPTLKGSLWKALCQKISPLHLLSSTEN